METRIKEVLIKHWGYSSFRPLQEDVILSVLQHKDTLALMPTGGGKSICFQVPGMLMEGLCLVVTPLIALMKDQVEKLKSKNIKAEAIYSGLSRFQIELIYNHCVYEKIKFLYVSPERLLTDEFIEMIRQTKINLIVVDEAHCISQWGYDFRPPYLQIAAIREYLPGVSVLALTATATTEVGQDIRKRLQFKNDVLYQAAFERKNLAYRVLFEEDKPKRLLKLFKEFPGTAIVYVRNRRKTMDTANFLIQNNIAADYYHAGLDNKTRDLKQRQWTSGKTKVIVATNAFGMGIDKADVRLVVHLDVPDSPEAYYQEAGRAGRDEKPSFAYLLWDHMDISQAESNFQQSYPEINFIKSVYKALGNFFQVPVGSGIDVSFDFDLQTFSENYNFNHLLVYNSLNILEKEGFIRITDAEKTNSQLMFSLQQENLYRFQVENPYYDQFIKMLLRNYGGLFTWYVVISELSLSNKTHIPEKNIRDMLMKLDKLGVVSYLPAKEKPQFIFSQNRIDEKNLSFSPETYAVRKQKAHDRLTAMIQYVTSDNKCRSRFLLSWFGQMHSLRCGICDVCLQRNKLEISNVEFDSFMEVMKAHIISKPQQQHELLSNFEIKDEAKAMSVLQWLMDNGKVKKDSNSMYIWCK
ncbi:MAG: ATP-dependent DNA helicase RecQ [Bacteroidota bacterium]